MTEKKTTTIGFLAFEGVEILDITGPLDVFSMANVVRKENKEKIPFTLYTISKEGEELKTLDKNFTIRPNYCFDNCPALDILIIPGGHPLITLDEVSYCWIAKKSEEVEILASVCIGAKLLAFASKFSDPLLKEKSVRITTHHGILDTLRGILEKNEKCATVVAGARYIDNRLDDKGKLKEDEVKKPALISTAGVSAGIDMAFHLLRQLEGDKLTFQTAKIMEYNWTVNWAQEPRSWSKATQNGYGLAKLFNELSEGLLCDFTSMGSEGGVEVEGITSNNKVCGVNPEELRRGFCFGGDISIEERPVSSFYETAQAPKLEKAMKKYLSDTKFFYLKGEEFGSVLPIYVVGMAPDGTFAGVKTGVVHS